MGNYRLAIGQLFVNSFQKRLKPKALIYMSKQLSWIEITSIANKSSNIIINYHFLNQNICFNFPKLFKIRLMNMRANFYETVLSHFNLKSFRPDNNQLSHFCISKVVLLKHNMRLGEDFCNIA